LEGTSGMKWSGGDDRGVAGPSEIFVRFAQDFKNGALMSAYTKKAVITVELIKLIK